MKIELIPLSDHQAIYEATVERIKENNLPEYFIYDFYD